MEFYAEMKLSGDGYAGGFSCGATMCGSDTIKGFEVKSDCHEKTVYKNHAGLELTVHRVPSGEAVRVHTEIYNGSSEEITVEMIASVAVKSITADKIHRLQSFWSAEGKLRTETIDDLHLEPSWNRCGLRFEKFGNVGSMPVRKYFPFLALEDSESGKVIGIQLCGASSWQMEILCKDDETLSVVGGLADGDFGQWKKTLSPDESFATPEAIVAEGGSLAEVCDKLVKAQQPHISPADDGMGIMFNEYCATWGNPSFENVKKICDKIAGKGIKYLVIDSGWYGTERWWESVGDWNVNENRFEGGMKPIADYIRSKGMIPGLWFEPEAVAWGCKYYNDPEHLLKKNGKPLTVGGRRFWDMEDPWVRDYLAGKVIRQLKDSGFGYVKIDYNDTIGMGCDGAESIGEALRRKVLASQEFFERIAVEIPDIVIENCSSGGHRLVPSMMELVSQASFSDAHETAAIPLIAANMHRVIKPEQSQIWAVMRASDTDERLHYSLAATFLGRMCLSGDVYNLSDRQWEIVERGIDFYRLAADIIKNGVTTVHRYTTTSYNEPTGEQLVIREYNGRGIAVLHRFSDSSDTGNILPDGAKIIAEFGNAHCDFSAAAWIFER